MSDDSGSTKDVNVTYLQKRITDLESKVETLESDNFKLREQKRNLNATIDTLQKNVPDENAVILSKNDAEKWKAYTELGNPDSIQQMKSDLAKLKKQSAVNRAARILNYNTDVLMTLLPETAKISFEKTTNDDGEELEAAYLEIDGKKSSLKKHAETTWNLFLPSLQQESKSEGTTGIRFPAQVANAPAPKPKIITQEEIVAKKLSDAAYKSI